MTTASKEEEEQVEITSPWSSGIWIVAAVAVLGAVTFVPGISGLGLLHDDWRYFHSVSTGVDPLSSPEGLRPLHGLPWRLCGLLFGSSLPGFYSFLFLLQFLAATVVFALARRWASPLFAGALAGLTLVFPADASHFWLASMPGRTAWLLALGAILLAETGRRRSRLIFLLPALALGQFALLLYELPFALLSFWPLLAGLLGAPWTRRQMTLWTTLPIGYLSWRLLFAAAARGSAVVHTDLTLDPLTLLWRAFVLVPYNLFVDGWLIGLRELVTGSPGAVTLFAITSYGVALLFFRGRPATTCPELPPPRGAIFGLAWIALGVAPIVPTTYWLGRSAGTFGGRILTCAIPGAALLLLLGLVAIVRSDRGRAVVFVTLLATSFAFHLEVGRQARQNWSVQEELAEALAERSWPRGSFLLLLDLPPNRLGFETPWGIGRMIQHATGNPRLSGVGISRDRADLVAVEDGKLLIHGGEIARVPLERVLFLRWEHGRLVTATPPKSRPDEGADGS